MAKILYALSGQGRGHTSRVMAVSEGLRERGHELIYCCGGVAYQILHDCGEEVIPVPALTHAHEGNGIGVVGSLRQNAHVLRRARNIVEELSATFEAAGVELLVNDFEAFSALAARRIGLPVLSLNHQHIVTETVYRVPVTHLFDAAVARLAIRLIAPVRPVHRLVPTFFFPPVRSPARTTLLPPIIREAVRTSRPTAGDHLLVYLTESDASRAVIDALGRCPARFIAYNAPPGISGVPANVTVRPPCLHAFLVDLAGCRGVICSAGFTLMSEALFLGKPLLVVPIRGHFEQMLNALFLVRAGLGTAVFGRPLEETDVKRFLNHIAAAAPMDRRVACGNVQAVEGIERLGLGIVSPSLRLTTPHQPVLRDSSCTI
jgi:uncharacterized protein (TIGR00661 family)